MKRRKFLTTTGAGLAGAAALRGGRLFGMPASLDADGEKINPAIVPHLLRLHFQVAEIPEDRQRHYAALTYVASSLLAEAALVSQFTQSPQRYLAEAGYPDVQLDTSSWEFQFLSALANPEIRAAAQSGDTLEFLSVLKRSGLFQSPDAGPDIKIANLVVVATVYAGLAISVAAVVVGVVAVINAIVIPTDAPPLPGTVRLAAVLGGKAFADKTTRTLVRQQADAVIHAIQSGEVEIQPGVSREQVVADIESSLARHAL